MNRNKIINDFDDAMSGLFNSHVQQLVTLALRMEFPGIEVYDAVDNEDGTITFKIKHDDRYTPEQIENFIVELRKTTAAEKKLV